MALNFQHIYKLLLLNMTHQDQKRKIIQSEVLSSHYLMLLFVFAVISTKICTLLDKSLFSNV